MSDKTTKFSAPLHDHIRSGHIVGILRFAADAPQEDLDEVGRLSLIGLLTIESHKALDAAMQIDDVAERNAALRRVGDINIKIGKLVKAGE